MKSIWIFKWYYIMMVTGDRTSFIRPIGINHWNLIIQMLLFPTEKVANIPKIESKRKSFVIIRFTRTRYLWCQKAHDWSIPRSCTEKTFVRQSHDEDGAEVKLDKYHNLRNPYWLLFSFLRKCPENRNKIKYILSL